MAKKAKEPKKEVPAAAGDEATAPKKRGKLKLIVLALVPLLVFGGGGYAGYAFFLAKPKAVAENDGEKGTEQGTDEKKTAGIPPEVAAESSFTYAYALSELLKRQCGEVVTAGLKAASEAEAKADGTIVNLSWQAANRRMDSITEKSCNRMLVEVDTAEAKAIAASKPKEAKGAAKE